MLRRIGVLVGLLVAVVGVTPAVATAGAGAPSPGPAVLLPALYGSNLAPVDLSICLDGEVFEASVESGTFLSLEPGTYRIQIGIAADPVVCDELSFVDEVIGVIPFDLVLAYNGANDVGGAQVGFGVYSFPECLDPDSADGLLTVINGANAFTLDATFRGEDVAVDLPNGEPITSLQLPGTDELRVLPAGTTQQPTIDVTIEGGQQTLAVAVGGVGGDEASRDFGVIAVNVPAAVCELPSSPTTPTTPVPPTTAAAAAAATPRFTG